MSNKLSKLEKLFLRVEEGNSTKTDSKKLKKFIDAFDKWATDDSPALFGDTFDELLKAREGLPDGNANAD